MTKGIFAEWAPKYWERGLSVIPIEPGTKKPALEGWTGNLSSPPNSKTKQQWLKNYANYNIGLLTGGEVVSEHVLFALDGDDNKYAKFLLKWLGLNRANRRTVLSGKKGKKGATFFILVPKADSFKSTVFQGAGDLGNIDVLGAGKQTVMPPSIHPDTGEPYTFVGTQLLEVPFEDLPEISKSELDALGVAVGSEHLQTIMKGEATHDAGLALTAKLVSKGATDEGITAIFEAFLPDGYDGNTLEELPGWITSAREKGFEKSGADEEETTTAMLVRLCLSSGAELFNYRSETAYVTFPTKEGARTVSVKSTAFKQWLRHRAHETFDKPLASSNPLNEAIQTLEGIALFDGPSIRVFIRVAGNHDKVEIDLGRPDGHVVSITKDDWEIKTESEFKLVRGAGFASLPDPVKGGDPRKLQGLLNFEDQTYNLVMAFILNALNPNGPFFAFLVEGEQGSGKSFVTQVLKMIIDPNQAEKTRLPDNERDLMIQAKEYWFLNFDNSSGMRADISDALCSLATGGGIAVRRLYTDSELNVLNYKRPFAINGISNFVNRPDLMERSIPVQLRPIEQGSRREEAELLAEFEKIHPEVFGAVCDAISQALRDRETVEAPKNLRMADAARWIKAGISALDVDPDKVIQELQETQDELFIERVLEDPLVMRIRSRTSEKPFDGYVGDLAALLDVGEDRNMPKSPSHLSKALHRLRPAMERAGVKVEFLEKDRGGRRIRIHSEPLGPPPKV